MRLQGLSQGLAQRLRAPEAPVCSCPWAYGQPQLLLSPPLGPFADFLACPSSLFAAIHQISAVDNSADTNSTKPQVSCRADPLSDTSSSPPRGLPCRSASRDPRRTRRSGAHEQCTSVQIANGTRTESCLLRLAGGQGNAPAGPPPPLRLYSKRHCCAHSWNALCAQTMALAFMGQALIIIHS